MKILDFHEKHYFSCIANIIKLLYSESHKNMFKLKVWKNDNKISTPSILGISCVSHCTVCWTYSWGFGWIFDQIIRIFSISLLSSRGRSSTNTCSISKILYALKSYDPNSFISGTFDAIPPRRRTKNHRWSWVNLGKIHLHHPNTSTVSGKSYFCKTRFLWAKKTSWLR